MKKTQAGRALELKKKQFSTLLLKWHRAKNTRKMPWKGEKDPYKIWLSEIILQQTRVEQGLAYYERFVAAFPDVNRLARAQEASVFKMWEGLGYYSRCRNLIASAKHIAETRSGYFPATYDEILQLKGIGPYTAAAISSFAFNLPHAVVDGNVFRVLARIFGITTPSDSTAGKKLFSRLANELLDKKQAGTYNQAIMDFGATICRPLSPLCGNCDFAKYCVALNTGRVNKLPVKEKKTIIRKRWFYYYVIDCNGSIAIRQRILKDIWHQLYEFPMIEVNGPITERKLLKEGEREQYISPRSYELISISPVFRQQLSHQIIEARFLKIKMNDTALDENGITWVKRGKLKTFAFPRIINRFLEG